MIVHARLFELIAQIVRLRKVGPFSQILSRTCITNSPLAVVRICAVLVVFDDVQCMITNSVAISVLKSITKHHIGNCKDAETMY